MEKKRATTTDQNQRQTSTATPKRSHKRRVSGPVRQMRLVLTESARQRQAANPWALDADTRSRGLEGVAEARRALEAVRDHLSQAS